MSTTPPLPPSLVFTDSSDIMTAVTDALMKSMKIESETNKVKQRQHELQLAIEQVNASLQLLSASSSNGEVVTPDLLARERKLIESNRQKRDAALREYEAAAKEGDSLRSDVIRLGADAKGFYDKCEQFNRERKDARLALKRLQQQRDQARVDRKELLERREQERLERIRVANLPFECEICANDDLPVHEKFILECCNKTICRECMNGQLTARIGEGAPEISCPMGCGKIVPEGDCATVLEDAAYARLLENSRRKVAESEGWAFCRAADCRGMVMRSDLGVVSSAPHHFVCSEHPRDVAHQWCLNCNAPWHEGQTCEKYQEWRQNNNNADAETEKLIQQMGWKKCPNCGNAVERVAGCNAMRCRCGCGFCNLCGYNAGTPGDAHPHFNIPGTPCYGKVWQGVYH